MLLLADPIQTNEAGIPQPDTPAGTTDDDGENYDSDEQDHKEDEELGYPARPFSPLAYPAAADESDGNLQDHAAGGEEGGGEEDLGDGLLQVGLLAHPPQLNKRRGCQSSPLSNHRTLVA